MWLCENGGFRQGRSLCGYHDLSKHLKGLSRPRGKPALGRSLTRFRFVISNPQGCDTGSGDLLAIDFLYYQSWHYNTKLLGSGL